MSDLWRFVLGFLVGVSPLLVSGCGYVKLECPNGEKITAAGFIPAKIQCDAPNAEPPKVEQP